MFGYLKDRFFLTCVALYALNRWAIKPALPSGEIFFTGYFNDLLLVPCALPPLLFVQRLLRLREINLPPRADEIVLHLFVWSLFFEAFAPLLFSSTRADVFDVVAYCTGALIGWLVWNRSSFFGQTDAPRNLTETQIPRTQESFISR